MPGTCCSPLPLLHPLMLQGEEQCHTLCFLQNSRKPAVHSVVSLPQGEKPHAGFPEAAYHQMAERLARAGHKVRNRKGLLADVLLCIDAMHCTASHL